MEEGNNPQIESLQRQLVESEQRLNKSREEVQPVVHEENNVEEPQVTERPAWLPEKFKSAEEMAKAYGELEGKLGNKEEAPKPPADFGEYNKYRDEFFNTGDLSPESWKELVEGKGIPKSIIEDYLNLGRTQAQTQRQQAEDKVLESIGGRAKFNEMAEWARKSLPQDMLDGLNAGLASENDKAIKFALKTLQEKYEGANKAKPKLMQGEAKPAKNDGAFASHAELMEAMSKKDKDGRKLYETSSVYRNQVIEKLKRSKL